MRSEQRADERSRESIEQETRDKKQGAMSREHSKPSNRREKQRSKNEEQRVGSREDLRRLAGGREGDGERQGVEHREPC